MEYEAPKYIQIEMHLINRIKEGFYLPGGRIPSENEIAEQFKVSRMTAGRAINELVNTRVVERIQGKGTYIRKDVRVAELFHDLSKSGKIHSEFDSSRTHETLEIKAVDPDAILTKRLNLKASNKVYQILRLQKSDDGQVLTIDHSYIPAKYLRPNPDFGPLDSCNLHEYMNGFSNIRGKYIHIHIDTKIADKEECKILDVKKDYPVVIWDTDVLDSDHIVIAFTTSIADPKRYRPYINFELME